MPEKKRIERKTRSEEPETGKESRLHPDTKKSVWAVALLGAAAILALAAFGKAGPLGEIAYGSLRTLFGFGYFVLPLSLVFAAGILSVSEKQKLVSVTLLGSGLIILAVLGLVELASPGNGGWLGLVFGALRIPFGKTAAVVINVFVLTIAVLVAANAPIKIKLPEKKTEKEPVVITGSGQKESARLLMDEKTAHPSEKEAPADGSGGSPDESPIQAPARQKTKSRPGGYVPPPLALLKSTSDKPTTGDLLANANIIKRTLDSFGIPVEMGEINVGPAVTRYTLKPAEGVKLSRIEALHKDLALALAAHPIRIEAPIPGKSLVGIEVPNKAAALVRLGSLMNYPEFQKSGLLGFALGRDVSGEPVFADIDKMPHLLVAGATGSGKSILIHSLLVSLLYKNSPATLKLILIDPKRVELSVYEGIPHLVSPVIVESKKAVGVFRWAISEMDRRYDILLRAGSRDVRSYNARLLSASPQAGGGQARVSSASVEDGQSPLPYLLVVVDELADLMTSFGREVEGFIVRLAQMARATGLHLVLSTQRPSVEVITGLIKANITSRAALQVASQVDSRTILDASGAEKLLGRGDMLYISSELSKPKRIQGAHISEEETNKVADFIREHNKTNGEDILLPSETGGVSGEYADASFGDYLDRDDDELYDEAVRVVAEAEKASASLLQRRLKVGYARAARLLDMMEERGVIGPGEGAKPREVFLDKI